MNLSLRQFSPARLLGFGLGATFLYAGIMSLADPTPWLGYVPGWIASLIPIVTFTEIHGVFQILLGAALLVGVLPKCAATFAALDIAAILAFYGIDLVTFRDFGLFFAAVALFTLSLNKTTPHESQSHPPQILQ